MHLYGAENAVEFLKLKASETKSPTNQKETNELWIFAI